MYTFSIKSKKLATFRSVTSWVSRLPYTAFYLCLVRNTELTDRLANFELNFYISKSVAAVGFEPTPPKRLVPKTSALDRSATLPIQHW